MKKKIAIVASAALGALAIIGVLGTRLAVAAVARGGAPFQRSEMWDRGARSIEYMPRAGVAPFFFFGIILFLVIVAIVVFLVVNILVNKKKAQNVTSQNAITILKERYVKGEISKEEFDAMKKDVLD